MSQPPAPAALLQLISCNCKKGCKNACICWKVGTKRYPDSNIYVPTSFSIKIICVILSFFDSVFRLKVFDMVHVLFGTNLPEC